MKCPHTYCYEKDSFFHMLECYRLVELVAMGADAVPFLAKMARVTLVPEGTARIPYMVEYYSAATERAAAAQEERSEENQRGDALDEEERVGNIVS